MMTFSSPVIRAAGPEDADAVWAILEPVIRAGETYRGALFGMNTWRVPTMHAHILGNGLITPERDHPNRILIYKEIAADHCDRQSCGFLVSFLTSSLESS
jgi:hypothetical protein